MTTWFYVIGFALLELVMWRAYSRSHVQRLRSHVQRLHEQHSDNKVEIELLREEAISLRERLELALVDWKRSERKLARARTSRARWQALGAEHERRYRNEFKRADQAETRLMRWQHVHKYETPAPAFKVVGELRPEQAQALREVQESKGLTRP